jgi:2-C-methyl-D-erythritol 2,4-cyclodiphosphate synthase/2-C-methyl-D-erythritol 4-phosphate cytidylyltransferase
MYKDSKVTALIAAGGLGLRLGRAFPKQFLSLGGESMLRRAALIFEQHEQVDEIVVVAPQEHIAAARAELKGVSKLVAVVSGGGTRQLSVYNGLAAIRGRRASNIVLIHDAARPYAEGELVRRVLEAAGEHSAAVACVPSKDTIYEAITADEAMRLKAPTTRSAMWIVQTPQGFSLDLILKAHEEALRMGEENASDDGTLVHMLGEPVYIVMGDYANIKITTPEDLPSAFAAGGALPDDGSLRVGMGFDVHAFAAGRKLILGGVEIPYEKGLLGHSDADVLTHAIMDAMLGALSMGDIGRHFPDDDPAYKGISSMELLRHVRQLVENDAWTVRQADTVIVAERPKLAPYVDIIRSSLAETLGLEASCVGIKATTTEGLGFTGREEGIGAQAVVLLSRTDAKSVNSVSQAGLAKNGK